MENFVNEFDILMQEKKENPFNEYKQAQAKRKCDNADILSNLDSKYKNMNTSDKQIQTTDSLDNTLE